MKREERLNYSSYLDICILSAGLNKRSLLVFFLGGKDSCWHTCYSGRRPNSYFFAQRGGIKDLLLEANN